MITVHRLKVFVDNEGNHGDMATVIIDEGRHISDDERQSITKKLNTVETVFVNNLSKADISIMHTQGETDFAGVAALGTAKLLEVMAERHITSMRGKAGSIAVSQEDGITWVRARLSAMPPWQHKQLDSAKDVEDIKVTETEDWEHRMVWAWIDKEKGLIRARTFASDWDIPEAQGNGSGSMLLSAIIGSPVEIRHGDGCVIYAKPAPNNCADIGGRVSQEPDREV